MNFSFKKIFLYLCLFFAMAAVSLVAYVHLNKDEIQSQLIDELNKKIETRITGDVSVSLFKNFPNVSLMFDQVIVDGSLPDHSAKLLSAETLALNLDFWSLFNENYQVHSITITNGQLSIMRDKSGQINYQFVSRNDNKQDSTISILSIDEAILKDVQVYYYDAYGKAKNNIGFFVKDGKLKGNFSRDHLSISAELTAKVDEISFDENQLLSNKDIQLSLQLASSTADGSFVISNGDLLVNDNRFLINGDITSNNQKDHVDLKIDAEGKNLEKLISLLPYRYRHSVEDFSGSGKYHLSAQINGDVSSAGAPEVDINFGITNGNIRSHKIKGELKNVQLKGNYSNGAGKKSKPSRLSIPEFSANLKGNKLIGTFMVTNFKDPKYTIHLNGSVNLANIAELITDSNLTTISGKINIDNFHFVGKKSDMQSIASSNLTGGGSLSFDNVLLAYNDVTYKKINGKLNFDRDKIDADKFMIQFLNTDLEFTGSLVNFVEYIFNLAKNKESKGTPLIANGKLVSQQIDLGEMIKGYSLRRDEAQQSGSGGKEITLQKIHNMEGKIDAEIELLVQDRLEFESIKANLELQPSQIKISEVSCSSMDGFIEGNGMVKFKPGNTINLEMNCHAEDIDIKTMFYQCNNFGQKVLNNEHLNGQLTTDLKFNSTWENFNKLQEDKLTADANLQINKGRLVNFEPINVLSRYIKLEELSDIQFSTIKNQIHISNRNIEIPSMEIESSVLNITTHGKHDFDNYIDYHFKVNLRALLAKKFNRKKNKVESKPIPEGGASLFISMKGPMMDPEVKYDKDAVKEKIKKDLKNEKQELKELFTREKDQPQEDPAEKAKENEKIFFDIEDEPEYIEWDEDTVSQVNKGG